MPRPEQLQLPFHGDNMPELVMTTLRPGVLVSIKTSVTGNASSTKEAIEPEHKTRSGATRAVWNTTRIIADADEYKKAEAVRLQARVMVVQVCNKTPSGFLLCPENQIEKLTLTIAEAERKVAEFNRRARLTRVSFYPFTTQIVQDDVKAVRAIKSDVRELIKEMAAGIKECKPQDARKAASNLKRVVGMLPANIAEKAKSAIDAARAAATKLVKAGEDAAEAIDREAIKKINQARTAFLDTDEDEAPAVATTAVVTQAPRQLDIEDGADEETANDNTTLTGRMPSERPARGSKPKKGTAKKAAPKKASRKTEARVSA